MIIFLDSFRRVLGYVLADINEEEKTRYNLDDKFLKRFVEYANGSKDLVVHNFYRQYKRYFLAFQEIDRFLRKRYINFNREQVEYG